MRVSRRVACGRLVSLISAFSAWQQQPASSDSSRVTAQSVGITDVNSGVLADPRALVDGEGIKPLIWGGRERCDPTDVACKQGGVESDLLNVQPVVPTEGRPTVTDRIGLDISVAGEKAGTIELGLWRSAAPESVDAFVRLAAGRLGDPDEEPASLERSVAVRVVKDKVVVLGALKNQGGSTVLVSGQTKPQRVPVRPPVTRDASNGISHDAAGLLSVRRGGGSFEFTLTPRANRELDAEDIVIGQVLSEQSMQLLERLNVLPTDNRRKAPLATVRIERARLRAVSGNVLDLATK